MRNRRNRGHCDLIFQYIEQHTGSVGSYEQTIEKLRSHPPGYRRCLCIYFSDADIDNGGFGQYYQNGFGCMTMSAIEGYERIGATKMADIMRSALYVCLKIHPALATYTNFSDVPKGFSDGFLPIATELGELESRYYDEAKQLPGSADFDSSYPVGPINYYYDNFPEDFH